MNILFDKLGNPQPQGRISIDFSSFEQIFVIDFNQSNSRPNIFIGYKNYISDFKQDISEAFTQWINGSFTTTKLNPNDIDLVNLVPHSSIKQTILLMRFLTIGGSKDKYLVDGYFIPLYPESDPRYLLVTKPQIDYWTNWFGQDRQANSKAIMEVNFN